MPIGLRDMTLSVTPQDGAVEVLVRRVVHLGSEVRVELELPDRSEARAQVTETQAEELEVVGGDIIYARSPVAVGA